MPDEKSLTRYYSRSDECLTNLIALLRNINSADTANEAVYELALIAKDNERIYKEMLFLQHKRESAVKILQHIMNQEQVVLQKEAYHRFLEEYTRVKSNDFFDSESLKCMLYAYFVADERNEVLLVWLPSTRLRLSGAVNGTHLNSSQVSPYTKKQIEEALTRKQIVATSHYKRTLGNEIVTLLMLDALYISGIRGNHETDQNIAAPTFFSIRGEMSMFENCLCSRYCFNRMRLSVSENKDSSGKLWHYTPYQIKQLDRAKALQHPGAKMYTDTYGTHVVIRLSRPVRSKYLIINFPVECEHPDSFEFSDDIPHVLPEQ